MQTARATVKDASINATPPAEGLKHIKPKPTNPKPFRLRTDVCKLHTHYLLFELFFFFLFRNFLLILIMEIDAQERRILKEANSEKKLDVGPFKEITLVSKLPRGRSLRNDKNVMLTFLSISYIMICFIC